MHQSYDIDRLLKPYEDSQPERVPTVSSKICRIPPLVDENGINPKFQTFYEKLVDAILFFDYSALYSISDQLISAKEFEALCTVNWSNHFSAWLLAVPRCRSIDIELNLERFQNLHRNLVGGFNIMTMHLTETQDEFSDRKVTTLKLAHTELLFKYVHNEFKIVTHINPFMMEE